MKIKIIKTPPGKARKTVREAWVGCIMQSTGREEALEEEGFKNLGGYRVDGQEAFSQLKLHRYGAYLWWKNKMPAALNGTLIFRADVCKEVPES